MTNSRTTKREYVLAALEKYERPITRYAVRMLAGNQDVAADVVQFVFMKLCQQDQTRKDGQLKAWLYTVCRNRIIDEYRKNGRHTSVDPAHIDLARCEKTDPQTDVENREWLHVLRERIDSLPDQEREIIDLWSNGLKHHEIAEVIAKKPGTVRVQLHRVIQLLKKEFGVTVTTQCKMQKAE